MSDRTKAARSSTPHIEKVAVLLVDDHVLVRRGFRRILDDEAHITVVGEAGDGVAAIRMAIDLKPKVVLMDFAMPIMNGLTATKKIVEACPGTLVLMLSMHSEDSWIQQAADAGARGFILKNAIDLDLGSAIRRVAAGEYLFEPNVPLDADRRRHRDLTAREAQILQLIVHGKSNAEIANQLNLSTNTVGAHRYRIMSVLGVRKASELVVYAIRNGLVNMP